MYFSIAQSSFPDTLQVYLDDAIHPDGYVAIKALTEINLLLEEGEDFSLSFSKPSIDRGMEIIKEMERIKGGEKIRIVIHSSNILTSDQVINILQNEDFLDRLSNEKFKDLLISSNEAAEFASSDKSVCTKLNNIETQLHKHLQMPPQPHVGSFLARGISIFQDLRALANRQRAGGHSASDREATSVFANALKPRIRTRDSELGFPQTFTNSCAAYAIMMLLKEHNKLTQADCTRHKELEIYKEIWRAPGEEADPQKLLHYCLQQGLPVKAIELSEKTSNYLKQMQGTAAYETACNTYGLFRQNFASNYQEIKRFETAKHEQLFKLGVSSLLILEGSHSSTHTVFGKRNQHGEFEVLDPSNGKKELYSSFTQFYHLKKEFLGIAVSIAP